MAGSNFSDYNELRLRIPVSSSFLLKKELKLYNTMAKNASLFVKMAAVLSLFLMLIVLSESRVTLIDGVQKAKSALVCSQVVGVEAGDDCTIISKEFGMSLASFLAINPNINCESVFVGQWSLINFVHSPNASARQIWLNIKALFYENIHATTLQLESELINISMGDLSVHDYCIKVKKIVDLLERLGKQVKENHVVIHAINGLSGKFDTHQTFPHFFINVIITHVLRLCVMLETSHQTTIVVAPTAIVRMKDGTTTPITITIVVNHSRTTSKKSLWVGIFSTTDTCFKSLLNISSVESSNNMGHAHNNNNFRLVIPKDNLIQLQMESLEFNQYKPTKQSTSFCATQQS
ncbi:unnamed protein product [Lactuca saligna]|uniref:LysM domain-containing protein n=1 Tax=Lactuca saligna TaxID=75948 RepID=A0AA35YTS3_LACSI|nr:unnamed protein product [Lactuca saligna]